ncbi:putative membrane protein [Helicobacter pylori Hp H-4]|nr:putative membrane protein [Helicobacter pylori Hp H-4]
MSGFVLPFYPFSYLFSFLVCYKIIFWLYSCQIGVTKTF